MAKQEQILIVEPPNELKFTGPFTSVVSSELLLKNPTSKPVLFKVKTTAPKRYCVRPNCGFIEPNQQVTVLVMLQPFDFDPAEKNTHKFMIQSMYAPPGTVESNEQIWKEAVPGQIIDNKLKCVFIQPPSSDSNYSQLLTATKTQNASANPVISSATGDVKQIVNTSKTEQKTTTNNLLEKGSDEVSTLQQLQLELEKLKAENMRLTTEGMRLRNISTSPGGQSQVFGPNRVEPRESIVTKLPPVLHLIIALIVGMIIAKLLF